MLHKKGAAAHQLTTLQFRRPKQREFHSERGGTRYGLQRMCIGVGQGIATIIERI